MVRVGAYILPFTLLIISHSLFFPFISGKNFAFRIIVEIITAGWLGLLIINFKKYWPRRSLVGVALVIFFGAAFLSAIFGVDFKNSFWSNFERMEGVITYLHLLALFFILTGTFHTRREWFGIFGVSIAASFLVAFYGLLEYSGVISSFGDSPRIISTFGNPLYVAAYLSFHIFLIAFLWFYIKSAILKWILAAVLLLEIPIFFLTGSRGAFVGMLAGAAIILLFWIFTAKSLKTRVILGSIAVFLIAVPILLNVFQDFSFIRNQEVLSRLSHITLEAGKTRFTLWGMAWEAFKERPILGWGAGNFDVPFAKYYDPRMYGQEPWYDRTHNMPLEWLVSGGLVGFLAYVILLGSIAPALAQGVKRNILQKPSTFIFIGMFAAYLIQLLLVFDTLPTYLTFILMLGFLHAVSSGSNDEWARKNTLVSPPTAANALISSFRLTGIIGGFLAVFLLVAFVNIRPLTANRALMKALIVFGEGNLEETLGSFEKALRLSRGTIGTTEIREHLAFNSSKLFSYPDVLRSPNGEALYSLTRDELEKQVAENSSQYPKIKHNILLAQLYHQKAISYGDGTALQKSFENYEKVILDAAPNYVSVYPIYANLLAQTGNINGAIMLTKKASEILKSADRYDARTFYSLSLFYTAVKRYDEAYSVLAEISAKYSGAEQNLDPEMMNNIVETTGRHGQDAVPFLKKIHELDEKLVSVPLILAQIHATLGEKELARFYALEALSKDPTIRQKVDEFLKAL